MGSGPSKTKPMQRDLQQPLSTQNKTNVTRSKYSTDASAQPFTKISSPSELSAKLSEQPLAQNTRQRSPPIVSSPEKNTKRSEQSLAQNTSQRSSLIASSPEKNTKRSEQPSAQNTSQRSSLVVSSPEKNKKRSEQPLAQTTEPRSVRILSSHSQMSTPIVLNSNRNSPKVNTLPNGSNRSVSSLPESSDNEFTDDEQTAPMNNNLNGLNTRSTTVSPPNRLTSKQGKISRLSTGHTGRCSFCPHCQQLPRDFIPKTSSRSSPQPPWIIDKAPSKNHQHIIMDHYDEDAIREKVILEYGRIPGSYDYAHNLTIEEEKNHNHSSSKYCTLPAVIKPGTPIAPSRTPFPNYDILRRHDKRLNKPYTPTLFAD